MLNMYQFITNYKFLVIYAFRIMYLVISNQAFFNNFQCDERVHNCINYRFINRKNIMGYLNINYYLHLWFYFNIIIIWKRKLWNQIYNILYLIKCFLYIDISIASKVAIHNVLSASLLLLLPFTTLNNKCIFASRLALELQKRNT